MIAITGIVLNRVQKYFMEDFNPNDQNLPNGICGRCRNILLDIDSGKPAALEDPVDFSTLNFPVLTRTFGGVTELKDLQGCTCSICLIARANPGQVGHTFGGKTKKGPFPVGRPPLPGPKRLATPKPIRICKRCKQVIGKGIQHPQPCGISDRRANLHDAMLEDPRGAEMAASALIKEKIDAAPKDSSCIQLATSGLPTNIPINCPSRARKSLFQDESVPASELQRLMTLNNMSQKQTEQTAKLIRSWNGQAESGRQVLRSVLQFEDV